MRIMPFSVLMSLYIKESPDYLRQSLDSVFNQTLPPDEVILVEDGPLTEDLYSVLDIYEQKYPQFKRVRIPVNGGLGKALNEGLKHCSNELVARMDTDDVCFHDRFEKQIDYMNSHPEIAALSGWIEEFENDIDNVRSVKRVPETPDEVKRYGVKRCPLNHPAVILRKSVVESVGGYIHFPLFEDWYLWARLMSHGYKLGNIQAPVLYFRVSPEMYRRRGGLKYAKDSFRFQRKLKELGLISGFQVVKYGVIRGLVYMMPNFMRRFVYRNFLRRQH